MKSSSPNALGRALRGFFSEYLTGVRGLSPNTILSYRDALALFLRFLAARSNRHVDRIDIEDIDAEGVIAFLNHIETDRGNCTVTRNARLAAVHALARYVAIRTPEHLERCQQVMAVPLKRTISRAVEYLDGDEFRAMLASTDRRTPDGRRDYTLILTFLNTGARVQELLDLRPVDLHLQHPLRVRLFGKGRKERFCPLWHITAVSLHSLMDEKGLSESSMEQLFRNRRGEPLTRFGVRYILQACAHRAEILMPSLAGRRVHPHTMRHTAAVHLLQAGVDLITISHWLGHASIETTNRYAVIDLETKRRALEKAGPITDDVLNPWRSKASILDWLEAL